jgi:hypothetical protein
MKCKLMIHWLIAAACITALFSCYTPRYMYSPSNTNVPNLEKKGDNKLAGYYAFGNSGTNSSSIEQSKFYNRGFDVQAAYAVTNHIALMCNLSNRYERNNGRFEQLFDSAVITYKRSLTELGIGWFGYFNKSSAQFQVFAGYGTGNFSFDDNGKDRSNTPYYRFHQAKVNKIFIQPAIIANLTKNFTTSFANRFNLVFFSSINTSYTPQEQELFLLDKIADKPSVFWEPAIINNFGFNNLPGLRFEIQLGFASLVSRKFIDYRTVNISVGAMANLRQLFFIKK